MKYLALIFIFLLSVLLASCKNNEEPASSFSPSIIQPTAALQESEAPAHSVSDPDKGKIIEFEDDFFKELMLDAIRFNAELSGETALITDIREEDLKGIYSLKLGTGPNFLKELNSFSIEYHKEVNGEDIRFMGNVWCTVNDYFAYDFITTLSDLQYFPELRELHLMAVKAEDLSPVYELDKLESLYISQLFYIDDISGISKLDNLKKLDISGRSIDMDEMYEQNPDLAERFAALNISETDVDMSFLIKMQNLEWLSVNHMKLDLKYVSELTKLKVLALQANTAEVTDLACLANLNNLQFLGLYFISNIRNAEALESLSGLKYLNYRDINIEEELIAGLNVKTDVEYVYLNSQPELYLS